MLYKIKHKMMKKLIVCLIGLYVNFVIFFLRMKPGLEYVHIELVGGYRKISTSALTKTVAKGGVDHIPVTNDTATERDSVTSSKSGDYSQILESYYHGDIGNKCPATCWNRTSEKGYETADTRFAAEQVAPECSLDRLTDNCEAFRKVHGYESISSTHEEERFPIAFAIKIHRLPNQAEHILRTLYRKHNIYCIHVDRRADDSLLELFNKIGKCLRNVVVIPDRLSVVLASYSNVVAEMKCMQTIRNSDVSWKYYINLSEQDFPLKTNLEMVKILSIFDGLNDIETYDHPVYENWRIESKFSVHKNSLVQESQKSPFKYELQFSKGNPYGMFSRQFVEFIFQDDVANEINQWLNDTYSPAENMWATLVTLPWAPGGYPVSVRHLMSTYMSRAMIVAGDRPRCHGKFDNAVCVFSCKDIWWLQSRPEFFATKFDSLYDKNVLKCLESWYRQKAAEPNVAKINWYLYYKLPHMKYHRLNKYSMASQEQREVIKKDWLLKHTKSTY